jgi:hypothetical protein
VNPPTIHPPNQPHGWLAYYIFRFSTQPEILKKEEKKKKKIKNLKSFYAGL